MIESNAGEVLGTRKLNSSHGLSLRITVWMPTMTDRGDFECRYRIAGANDDEIRCSVGLDGIQAVWLALQTIGSDLSVMEKRLGVKFFIGSGDVLPSHGFPKIAGFD